jgi:hypothetical protein
MSREARPQGRDPADADAAAGTLTARKDFPFALSVEPARIGAEVGKWIKTLEPIAPPES